MEDQRNVGESSCKSEDGTDQRVQSLMFMMMTYLRKAQMKFLRHLLGITKLDKEKKTNVLGKKKQEQRI